MSQNLGILLAALAGLGGGAISQVLFTDPAPTHADGSSVVAAASVDEDEIREMRDQLNVLQGNLGVLNSRLAELGATGRRAADPVSSLPGADLDPADVNAFHAAELAMQWVGHDQFTAAVDAAIEQREEQERLEREQEREERRQRQHEERMERYAQELGLTADQSAAMSDILVAADARRTEMWTEMREGNMDRGEIREVMGTMNDERDAQLSNVLNAEQMTQFEEMGNNDWGGFGRGGDRGGNGGGNGGGGRGRG